MNLESISRTDGLAAPAMVPVVRVDTGRTRQVRENSSGVRAEEVDRRASSTESDQEPVDRETIERAVEAANMGPDFLNEKLGFKVHDATGQILVQILDRETGEVVRETPPREFLDLLARMREMVGLFIDEQG